MRISVRSCNPENQGLADLSLREWLVLAPLLIGIVWMGVAPGPVLRRMEPAARQYLQITQPAAQLAAPGLSAEVQP